MDGCEKRNWREDYDAQCPFYRREDGLVLVCEGVTPESSLGLRFAQKQQKRAHKAVFCICANWKNCPVAQMLNRMYDYDPN